MSITTPERPPLTEEREQLALLSRTLEREAHILLREPEVLASHLHNMLFLDEGEEGPAGPLLARAREALAGRPWLRLTNRPPVERSALLRVLDHGAWVEAIAWSPDGTVLASGAWDHMIRLWDPVAWKPLATLKGHTGPIEALAWSPDGFLLASGAQRGEVRLWEPATGRRHSVLRGHTPKGGGIETLAWSPDGALLASADQTTVRLWESVTGKPVAVLEGDRDLVGRLAWSPDGSRLFSTHFSSGVGRTLRLWDRGGKLVRALELAADAAAAWSPDGTVLASVEESAGSKTVQLWDPTAAKPVAVLEGHTKGVSVLAWSPDGAILASAGGDHTVRLWDPTAAKPVAVLEGHTRGVGVLAWSLDGAILASAGGDHTVRLWNPTAAKPVAVLEGSLPLAWSPDGSLLASPAQNKQVVRVWDGATGKAVAVLEGHTGPFKTLAWSPDGSLLASATPTLLGDHTVRIWDPARARVAAGLEGGHEYSVGAVAWSPDGVLLVAGGIGRTTLWDAATGRPLAVLEESPKLRGLYGWPYHACALAWSPDGAKVGSGGSGGFVRLLDVTTGRVEAELKLHTGVVASLAWSPTGAILASGGGSGPGSPSEREEDQTVRLCDPATGDLRAVLRGHPRPGGSGAEEFRVRALAWSPDGTILASAGDDDAVRLWNWVTGEPGSALEIKYTRHRALAWSPDGTTLASGSHDTTVRLWEPATGKLLTLLKGHTGRANTLAWSPDGTTLASGSHDTTVRLWDLGGDSCWLVAHCLSPVLALQFSEDGHILRAADDGGATGNRPIPYLFELCNIESGPPVAHPVPSHQTPRVNRNAEA